ncbi:hypothetical protein PIB30_015508 [Stylosanthes scabra]|uniref:J domain-containing protein n=1 Tax=Stylosanthes scabra TaxID=79078 RepID=A0ABU6X7C1_9FABA|nr:hypothetical protein [Stylosanthes scabra]
MNDFDGLLTTDFGFKPQGKSAPMAASKGSSNFSTATSSLNFDLGSKPPRTSNSFSGGTDSLFSDHKNQDSDGFGDIFGGSARFADKSDGRGTSDAAFNLDSMFSTSRSVNLPPVYDKPVYDDDIFDGVPGLKSTSSSKVAYDDVFTGAGGGSGSGGSAFDDLLGGFGKAEQDSKSSSGRRLEKEDKDVADFDELLPGFGSSKSSSDRLTPDVAFSSERSNRKGSNSPPQRSNASTGWTGDRESTEKSYIRSPEQENDFHQAPFEVPTYSSNSNKPARHRSTSPPYDNGGFRQTNVQADMPPSYEENLESSDDIWLTVSEVPLFTQPTAAPPPSRPPPPRPVHIHKSGTGSSATTTNARKKDSEFSSFPSSAQFSQVPKSTAAAKFSSTSQFDELEDFAMGRNHGNNEDLVNGFPDEELEMNSAAAAIKEAMDKAEAKFRHAKEVRERESTKAARSRETVQTEKDDRAVLEERERQERLDREQKQKEREEKEKERQRFEREREREMARQAVERATREARERAAIEARQRAQRAAVEKANAEARERAERAAVQRAQSEARERAAAEAKERAEKAAAEARERAEKEARDRERAAAEARVKTERAAVERAAAEARVKAERAAVERAAAEARERAAAEARERAAAAARMKQQQQQQNNENDLESFFSMGRASSVPRPPRTSSTDSVFDAQFQSDVTRKSTSVSSSMKKASSSVNIVDDLSSIFGTAPSSGEFQEVEGESDERRRARMERHQRAQERAAKALAEKNQRDLQTQREQAERHRLAETLDFEIKRWAAGKEGNLRALLSTLQYVLWPECGWQPVSLTDLITGAAVKKAYRKATLCIHPDKVQQKGATLQQKYIAEKVFDLLKEAWNKFNSEELF